MEEQYIIHEQTCLVCRVGEFCLKPNNSEAPKACGTHSLEKVKEMLLFFFLFLGVQKLRALQMLATGKEAAFSPQ